MTYEKMILEHYQKEAVSKGLSKSSTMHDDYIREKEVEFILNEINCYHALVSRALKVLDLGCGNGYLLSLLTEKYDNFKFFGMEFTEELYELAVSRKLKNTVIIKGDCREQKMGGELFDVIISERVLINLLSRDDKVKAINNISTLLKKNGRYIMVESFEEPLVNINKARKELLLDEMKPAYHNEYLTEEIVDTMTDLGFTELRSTFPKNSLSSHYFISRVLHESIRPKEGAVKNTEFVKFFDLALPPTIGDYSPILFRIFEKNREE